MLEAQGYDVSAFDKWAGQSYEGYVADPDAEPVVDTNSVLSLGYGPISEEKLFELVEQGIVEEYRENGKIKFRRVMQPNPYGKFNMFQ